MCRRVSQPVFDRPLRDLPTEKMYNADRYACHLRRGFLSSVDIAPTVFFRNDNSKRNLSSRVVG